jgi:hypothetical protein
MEWGYGYGMVIGTYRRLMQQASPPPPPGSGQGPMTLSESSLRELQGNLDLENCAT